VTTAPPGDTDDLLERVRARLDASPRLDASRVELRVAGGRLVLLGAVASAEESSAVVALAEQEAGDVVDDLLVEPSLREGGAPAAGYDSVEPPGDEVLVGDLDEFAAAEDGPRVGDDDWALEENDSYDPPDEELLVPTAAEERGAGPLVYPPDDVATAAAAAEDDLDGDDDLDGEAGPAAADVTEAELRAPGGAPALDPELLAPPQAWDDTPTEGLG
jgi:hypothetical protein